MQYEFENFVDDRWDGPIKPLGHKWITASLGIAGETGEVVELLKKHFRDDKHPRKNLLLELGDVIHYATVIAHAYGWTLDDVFKANMMKLYERDKRK